MAIVQPALWSTFGGAGCAMFPRGRQAHEGVNGSTAALAFVDVEMKDRPE